MTTTPLTQATEAPNYEAVIIRRHQKIVGFVNYTQSGFELLKWFHKTHSYAVDHAVEYEGYSLEYLESVDCHKVENWLGELCESHGVAVSLRFVPFSHSRNKDKKYKSLNWVYTLTKEGRKGSLSGDYAQGQAHCPAYKLQTKIRPDKQRAINAECETGFICRVESYGIQETRKPIPRPSLGAIASCLGSDFSTVKDYESFKDWADSLGCDSDSISAKETYDSIVNQYAEARRLLGSTLVDSIITLSGYN